MTTDKIGKLEKQVKVLSRAVIDLELSYEEKVRELSLLRRLGDLFYYVIDLHEACQRIVDILYDEFLPDNCSIMLYDHKSDVLELFAIKSKVIFETDAENYSPRIGKKFKIGEGAAGRAVEQRKVISINDISKDKRFVVYDEISVNVKSLICIPLLIQNKPDGVINISYNQPNIIPREKLHIFDLLMQNIGHGIGNIRLFNELKDANRTLQDTNENLHITLAELHKTQQYIFNSEELSGVGILAAGIAHEFNNIFAGILGYSELSLISTDKKEHKKNFEIIIKLSNRAVKIIENLLDFSRKPALKKVKANINAELKTILEFVQPGLKNAGIKIKKYLGKIPNIDCDISKLSRVFLHLISNARDGMEETGGTLTIKTGKGANWVEILIIDTGKGIEPNILKNIFDPFVTTKGAFGGSTQPGTGLGLSVAYGIVKNHGGDIEISSKVGLGTEVKIRLPITDKRNIIAQEQTGNIKYLTRIKAKM